jgi:hypothetical protein
MIVSKGEKLHIVYRRHFDSEMRRHFIGEIIEAKDAVVRLKGNAIIYDNSKNAYAKKPETRTTIIDLAASGYIVNIIDIDVDINELHYVYDNNKRLILTDDKNFSLDINEFGLNR